MQTCSGSLRSRTCSFIASGLHFLLPTHLDLDDARGPARALPSSGENDFRRSRGGVQIRRQLCGIQRPAILSSSQQMKIVAVLLIIFMKMKRILKPTNGRRSRLDLLKGTFRNSISELFNSFNLYSALVIRCLISLATRSSFQARFLRFFLLLLLA